jgi:hypothetical protein
MSEGKGMAQAVQIVQIVPASRGRTKKGELNGAERLNSLNIWNFKPRWPTMTS